jgi:acyl-coenzyme A synthetase/AMP-(fatty) acid ligase
LRRLITRRSRVRIPPRYKESPGNSGFFLGQLASEIGARAISASELENIACADDGVIEAAAYAVPGEFSEHEVKLDVVAAPEFTMPALHAWLAERLPGFMVPPYLERCAEFPKTPSERIEKHKLAACRFERDEVHEFEPARAPAP